MDEHANGNAAIEWQHVAQQNEGATRGVLLPVSEMPGMPMRPGRAARHPLAR